MKDETKIATLGPYAAALSYILANANKTRVKASKANRDKYKNIIVYRGICITKTEFCKQFRKDIN